MISSVLTKYMSPKTLALATVLLWSSAFVGTRLAMQCYSITALSTVRCSVSAAVLLLLALIRKDTAMPPLREWPLFFLCGALGFSVYLILFNKGLETLPAATSCVLLATVPILTALASSLVFRERLPLRAWAAIIMGFTGVAVLMLWNNNLVFDRGVLWTLAAGILFCGYNMLSRILSRRYSAMHITAYSFYAATVMLIPWFGHTCEVLGSLSTTQIAAGIFLGIFPGAIAYVLWAKALALATCTNEVTNFMFLTPFFSLLLGFLVMEEIPGPETYLGGTLILSGLLLFNRATQKQ